MLVMRAPRHAENSLTVTSQCSKWHTRRGSQIPKFDDRAAIVVRCRKQMEALCWIPRYVGYGLIAGLDIAPDFSALDVPNTHGAVSRCACHDVCNLGVPGHGRNLGSLLAAVGTRQKWCRVWLLQVDNEHLPIASTRSQLCRYQRTELNSFDWSRNMLGKRNNRRCSCCRLLLHDCSWIPDVNSAVFHPPSDQSKRMLFWIRYRPR
mmetsp:Transcript_1296/g.2729  ORF Transcript_1296/g.2729 Transcript_1296/m.2729 type:complete len:206 (+) Transcript_1296:2294-2911(+)